MDQIFSVLLSTSMFVGGAIGFVLDNTIPGWYCLSSYHFSQFSRIPIVEIFFALLLTKIRYARNAFYYYYNIRCIPPKIGYNFFSIP